MAKGKKTGGRRKGSQNKTTRAFKEMITQCLEDVGGRETLKTWAQANLTEFYKIAARLIPTEVAGTADAPIPLTIELTDGATPPPYAE